MDQKPRSFRNNNKKFLRNAPFAKLRRGNIQGQLRDERWEEFKKTMRGMSPDDRFEALTNYLIANQYSMEAQVRVKGYVDALKRYGRV